MLVFQCGELLSHISARGQWRWWRVLLRQAGRAQLRQENQRLIVPMVTHTCVVHPTPVYYTVLSVAHPALSFTHLLS